jgi:hypothetical protein
VIIIIMIIIIIIISKLVLTRMPMTTPLSSVYNLHFVWTRQWVSLAEVTDPSLGVQAVGTAVNLNK